VVPHSGAGYTTDVGILRFSTITLADEGRECAGETEVNHQLPVVCKKLWSPGDENGGYEEGGLELHG
jgi:hypothetical protein